MANHYLAGLDLYELLFGAYAPMFWGGVVISIGIAIPLLLEIALLRVNPLNRTAAVMIAIIFVAVIVGGYTLRYVVIATAYFHTPITPFYNTQPQWGSMVGGDGHGNHHKAYP
ncbi:NrfD/PsrC family molybdoenzyme membrane anchor subunit [Vulcanisaeta souniana]|uniref:NrfD/PsrC family molybdoenzyme membrane anchor subunit n=1 Tax=Vulcanisaeta souniana TaxID=164452 RepID=UPI001FB2FEF4|nr:NrfD/PsrC family molybdoenzyme membrane anchor subunit [Vulcanisaeta souniana]